MPAHTKMNAEDMAALPLVPPGDLAGRLEYYYTLVKRVILARQDPITGLLPASTAVLAHGDYTDAWVRDNVYSILAAWGLGLAYRKVDWDRGCTYELEQSVVKTMRGLLFAMMRQADKVERFKHTQNPLDALHAKYDTRTGGTTVGDAEWGHLQIDATSLWLLMFGQMTASGLSILFTLDEVNFVQNLIYYIGRAYRTPDYGIWERGEKINSGSAELNASSVGMAKAALEALQGLDAFGVHGSQASVLHVLSDEIARSRITLESLLPWESSSKEVDSALLTIVGFPAFAVEDEDLARRTREGIVARLGGRYGCKRFLRDGHQTAIEDPNRLHYEPRELQQFEHIECEWPLFFAYLLLDALFRKDAEAAREYRKRLVSVLVEQDGVSLLPELYTVPAERIDAERRSPGSQERQPNANIPLVWAQSLYYLAGMLDEGLLEPGEIDPLGRRLRLGAQRDPLVQIALLAEDEALQGELEAQGVATQTPPQIEPIQVRRASELAEAYHQIGRNDPLRLTGRPIRRLRSLTTSKVFQIQGRTMVFLPSFLDPQKFYLMLDRDFLVAQIRAELAYIRRHWRQGGRPTMTLLLTRALLETGRAALLDLIGEMATGCCGSVHVRLGRLGELRQTAGAERIDDLHEFQFSHDPIRDVRPAQYRLAADPAQAAPLDRREELRIEQEPDAEVLLARLWVTQNLYELVEILGVLHRRHGPDFPVGESAVVRDLLEDVYAQAAHGDGEGRPLWAVVRRAAALCDKTDMALSDAVTDILVRQKQITVGKSYSDASVIARPLPPGEIRDKVRAFGGEDVRDHVLTQELLIYLGLLIRAEPALFGRLMTLRVGYLIRLMTGELAAEMGVRPEEAHERLMRLSPSEVQRRLRGVLGDYDDTARRLQNQESLPLGGGVVEAAAPHFEKSPGKSSDPPDGWRRWRQREGALNRVPPDFYPRVWNLLRHCRGLIIGEKLEIRNRLDSALILSETTAGEKNFALWVEHLLNKMDASKYRQLTIEALTALAALVERTPDLQVDDYLVLDVLIGHAVRLCWLDLHPAREADYEEDKPAAWQAFYDASPPVCAAHVVGALQFLARMDTP